ncbi:hypothetical protein FisN_4Lh424 [Fistulifera solaris]|uniref:Glutaminyl-peptide cyclotransferase n=1 Tax=Fistulifera solaris TaxID=1519565 RepID=A0A1Z5KDD0_FISSO|nr:hypothetical protein FisN_4Lh424 [Fistulifera solaris]|eukprot:GAX24310.1 hypothetical protein FisN_4Lh424 [Fistulifera solaris]
MSGDVEMTFPRGRQNLEMSLPRDIVERRSPRKVTAGLVLVSLLLSGVIASLAFFYRRNDFVKTDVLIDDNSPEKTMNDEQASWAAAVVTLEDGIKYEIVKQLKHDSNSFIEGLAYFNGSLFESSGMNGHSKVQRLDPQTGEVIESQSFPSGSKYFGEGLTVVDSKLYVLTYKAKRGFIFDSKNITAPPDQFHFNTTTGEGWGLTYDASKHELIASDGSKFLHFWDPDTFALKRKVEVKRQNSRNSKNINELEWWRGRVLANIWYEDVLIVIDPETGVVEKEYGKHLCSELFALPGYVLISYA